MTPTSLEAKVHDFLAQKRIAVAGVSRDNSHHPAGNLIYHRLKQTGHHVFPVNPHMQTFDGDRCYPDLRSIPGGVDGVVIITRPETTERIVRDCSDAGVRRVWMHESLGKGSSVSPEAVEYCRRTRYQRDRRRLPDDVRPRRRFRPQVHAALHETDGRATHMRRRRIAWILILIVEVGYIAWGAGAAAIAGPPARPRRQGDPAGGLRGLLGRVLVGARGHLPARRGIHRRCSSGCTAFTASCSESWAAPSR